MLPDQDLKIISINLNITFGVSYRSGRLPLSHSCPPGHFNNDAIDIFCQAVGRDKQVDLDWIYIMNAN